MAFKRTISLKLTAQYVWCRVINGPKIWPEPKSVSLNLNLIWGPINCRFTWSLQLGPAFYRDFFQSIFFLFSSWTLFKKASIESRSRLQWSWKPVKNGPEKTRKLVAGLKNPTCYKKNYWSTVVCNWFRIIGSVQV